MATRHPLISINTSSIPFFIPHLHTMVPFWFVGSSSLLLGVSGVAATGGFPPVTSPPGACGLLPADASCATVFEQCVNTLVRCQSPTDCDIDELISSHSKTKLIRTVMKPASRRPHVIQAIPIHSFLTFTAVFLALLEIRLGAQTFLASMFRCVISFFLVSIL